MVELLVASAILVTAFLGASAVAQKSLQVSRQSAHAAQASFLLEEGAEAVRVLRDNGWSNISSLAISSTYYPLYAAGTWTLSVTPNTAGIFERTVAVSNVTRDSNSNIASTGTVDTHIKFFTVTVSWMEGASTITKTLSFYLTDIHS